MTLPHHLAPPPTVTPICPYFGVCGGCDAQDVGYTDQLRAKEAWIQELFAATKPRAVLPILGSPQSYPTFFRNKIRFSFIRTEDGVVHPSRHQRGNDLADIPAERCYLLSEESNQIIQTIARHATAHQWSLYDPRTQTGWLKHVLIRHGKQTGEVMLCLVTDASPIPDRAAFTNQVTTELPFVSSLYHSQSYGRRVDHIEDELLAGEPVIHEKVGQYRFQISPQAFFQTNSEMVETLYSTIKTSAGEGNVLWDLYAGSATIGLFLSEAFSQVSCIESNPSNCQDAHANITLNQRPNVQILQGAVEDLLTSAFITNQPPPDCIVVDPPRAGLHRRLRQLLPALPFQRLVYVSCNPLTALRDIQELRHHGLQCTSLQPLDLFPHSWHTELVAVLEKS